MGTLLHAFDDLLTFGTIIILAMIVGGALVVLTMVADSVWLFRAAHQQHEEEPQAGWLATLRQWRHHQRQLKKSA
jgi:heme/copper-type cytochrome/quinol oxidase subunit 2